MMSQENIAFHLFHEIDVRHLDSFEEMAWAFDCLCLSFEPPHPDAWPAETDYLPSEGLVVAKITFETLSQAERFQEYLKTLSNNPDELDISQEKILPWLDYHRPYLEPIYFSKLIIYPWTEQEHNTKNSEVPTESVESIFLPAGLGFGTGRHETTQLCLEALCSLPLKDQSVLDFGSGSGILTIAAAKLGAKEVQYHDHDPQAMRASEDNIELNHVKNNTTPRLSSKDMSAVDLVVANILLEPLLELQPLLCSCLKSGGIGVFSGLLESQQERFLAQYLADMDLIEVRNKEQWICIVMKKK